MKKTKKQEEWIEKARKHVNLDKKELRSKDVAHLLDCSPDDVIQFARSGKLVASKHGRFWRFRLKDVVKFKKQRDKEEDEYLKRMDRERYGSAYATN